MSYAIKLDTVFKEITPDTWYHSRVAPMPGFGNNGTTAVVMTIQRELKASDYYSGLYYLLTKDNGKTWTKPVMPKELDWIPVNAKVDIAVCDVTPGWHAKTQKVIAIGAQVRYSKTGQQLEDIKRAHQTAYTIYDPKTDQWTKWAQLEVPDDDGFNFARNACAQWLVQSNGNLLVPMYVGINARVPTSVTVVEYKFDGNKLSYVRHGNMLELKEVRGLGEPSLAAYKGKYYLTIRNDIRGYVSVSNDGLNFGPIKAWKFDDGSELGSYNTQQHWVSHSDGLFLVYTRRGANNDHIMRNRAPLFIAQVDTDKLCVIRSTEKIAVPERGAELGNFGADAITSKESWITVSEFLCSPDSQKRGAEGATFASRIIWNQPNKQAYAAT